MVLVYIFLLRLLSGLPENQGYNSFQELKEAIGSAGNGKHWHYIVKQSQIGKSSYTSQQINNTSNIIAIDSAVHAKIRGYYNTKSFDFINCLSVRNWLAGQNFDVQYEFGINVLRQYRVIK